MSSDATVLPLALVAHTRRVPAAERQRLADRLVAARVPGLLLQTCHRVELYASDASAVHRLEGDLPSGVEVLAGGEAAHHVISVAVGLDSVILGEDQILHQLRTATAAARSAGVIDPVVDRIVSLALRAGRQARSWRPGPSPSLADAALAAVEHRVGSLADRRVLVIGSGEMGRLVVDRARMKHAAVTVASRTLENARRVALVAKVEVGPMDRGDAARELTAVIVAVRGAWQVGPRTVEALADGRAVVVDLSLPSATDARLIERLAGRFVSIDDLAAEPESVELHADVPRMRALVDATVAEFLAWMDGRASRVAAQVLMERAEGERIAELDALWRSLPGLAPEAKTAIERMSRHLATRILREPLERLGRDADGHVERAARELFSL